MCSPYSLLMCLYEAMLTWPGIPWLNYGLCAFSHLLALLVYVFVVWQQTILNLNLKSTVNGTSLATTFDTDIILARPPVNQWCCCTSCGPTACTANTRWSYCQLRQGKQQGSTYHSSQGHKKILIFIEEHAVENIICKMASILSKFQCADLPSGRSWPSEIGMKLILIPVVSTMNTVNIAMILKDDWHILTGTSRLGLNPLYL